MQQHCDVCDHMTEWDTSKEFGDHDWCKICGYSKEMFESLPGGCPEHPDSTHLDGYGLAAGGYGAYSICDECGAFFDTIEFSEDWE